MLARSRELRLGAFNHTQEQCQAHEGWTGVFLGRWRLHLPKLAGGPRCARRAAAATCPKRGLGGPPLSAQHRQPLLRLLHTPARPNSPPRATACKSASKPRNARRRSFTPTHFPHHSAISSASSGALQAPCKRPIQEAEMNRATRLFWLFLGLQVCVGGLCACGAMRPGPAGRAWVLGRPRRRGCRPPPHLLPPPECVCMLPGPPAADPVCRHHPHRDQHPAGPERHLLPQR